MLKDHKANLRTSTPSWLLNPYKSELGKINKLILEKANQYLVDLLSWNQWKKSDMVINWFVSIKNKFQYAFIQLDIVEFYPSVTKVILNHELSFAKQHLEISDKNLRINKDCRNRCNTKMKHKKRKTEIIV